MRVKKVALMSFKFKMQKVLDYREQLEEEARVRLANAEGKLRECREKIAELQERLREAEDKLSSAALLQNAERWLQERYVKGLLADRKALALEEKTLNQIAVEARQYLAERAIDRKMLDKLKEKQKIQFERAEQKQEQYFNDEIATIRYKAQAV